MKKLIENKEKVKTIIIIILLIVIAFLCLRVNFEKSTVARYRDKLNEKRCPSINHTNSNSTIEDTTPENNNGVVEDSQEEKTKYEKILEKYTFGDSHMDNWLNTLFTNKLNDMNKLYMVLRSEDNIRETTSIKCQELFPNFKLKDDPTGKQVEENGKKAFCNSTNPYYSYKQLNAEYHIMFGNATNLPKMQGLISFPVGSGGYLPYAYSEKVNGYVLLDCRCGGTGMPKAFYRIIGTNEEGNKLTIEIKYLELKGANINSTDISDDNLNKRFKDESLKKYKFNFINENDNYYLVSIDGQ